MQYKLHPTDRPRIKEKIPFYRQKVFHATYLCFVPFLVVLAVKEISKEPPPVNVIDTIRHYRNSVNIQLDSESVPEKPEYSFGKLSENQYYLDIHYSTVRYQFDIPYSYGCVESIKRLPVGNDTLRTIITFRSLKDEPEIEYIEDKAAFKLTYNKYLDEKYFVVIDPGHGGPSTGAVGRSGTKEKNITLDIVKRINEHLKKHDDIMTILTRDSDTDIQIRERKRISNFWNADLFLSIHANGSRNRSVNQSEIYYYNPQSQNDARIIRDNLQRVLSNGRGVIRRIPYGILWQNYANSSLLIEAMYLSNKIGEQKLKEKKYRKIIAESIYKSILEIKQASMGK
ncbi:N-acetylmuramoyl-L-alanine amidase [candidate division KSB1 bacterium]